MLRPFRTVAAGDRFGDAHDDATGTSGFIVYDSAADFRETLVGLIVAPLGYLAPPSGARSRSSASTR